MVATNTSATSKYYTDGSETEIDSHYYRPRLKMLSSVTQKAPFFYEDNFPVSQISFQIYMDSTDRSFWLAKEMLQGSIKLYIGASEADQLSEMTCIFIGRVPVNGISAVRDIVSVTAIDWIDAWETIYPMSTKSVYYQNKIKGNIKVEKEEASIPIIFGDYREGGAWDVSKVVTTEYNRTGTDNVNMPVKYYLLGNSEYQDLFGSMPDMFGSLEFSNVGLVDISVYGDTGASDRTAGYIWTGDYGKPEWTRCAFEGIEKRPEGENQKFTDGYNIEVGTFHQPGWHWYDNNTYDILTVGNPEGWDYLYETEAKAQLKAFWMLWHDTDDDCLYVSSMNSNDYLTWDGLNLYATGASNWKRSVHEHEDDGGAEITVSDYTHLHIWKKSFAYRAIEDGVTCYEVGTFMERNDSGTIDIDLVAYYSGDNSECESIVNKQTNAAADLGSITWADGCPRTVVVTGDTDQHSAIVIGTEGAYIYNISDAGGVLWFVNVPNPTNGFYDLSNIGCCCFHTKDDGALYEYDDSIDVYRHNYEHQVERLINAAAIWDDSETYKMRLFTIQVSGNLYYWTEISASNSDTFTNITTPQIAGYIISDQKPTTSYDKFYYVFLNDENDSGQSYLYVRDYVNGAEGKREIPLNFHWIYDVAVISRSTDSVTVLVATTDGIYAADGEELFFGDGAIAKYNAGNNDNDQAVADAFQLVSKEKVNCLTTAAKYSQYQYPETIYRGSSYTRNPYEGLWGLWGCSLSRTDDGLYLDWQVDPATSVLDSENNEIRLTTKANSLDQLGWYGDCNINSTEMTNWEYIPMYLLWRAEGNTSFEVGTTHIPNTVDSSSWNTAKALRDDYFTGNIRVNIRNKDRVINHVWRLVKQMGHRMYAKYSGGSYPQLCLDFAFDTKTSSKTLTEHDLTNVHMKYYEGYISSLRGQWNVVRDNPYSWAEVSLSSVYGGVRELDFPMDIYVEYDEGVYTAKGGNSSWQTLFGFLLAHESGFDAHDDSEDRPLRVVTCYVSPEHWSTALLTCVTIDSTDYPEATGDYILYQKTMDCSNMSQQWVLLEQSDLDYDGSSYAP